MTSINRQMTVSIIISALVIAWAFWFVSDKSAAGDNLSGRPAVSFAEGRQMIDILAKGGYSPRNIAAKAGVPTVLRIKTEGTFDCSASLVIPALSYQKFLEPSGTEEIIIDAKLAQGALRGFCSMGMYSFQINFS